MHSENASAPGGVSVDALEREPAALEAELLGVPELPPQPATRAAAAIVATASSVASFGSAQVSLDAAVPAWSVSRAGGKVNALCTALRVTRS
jgi:hypothetical protein